MDSYVCIECGKPLTKVDKPLDYYTCPNQHFWRLDYKGVWRKEAKGYCSKCISAFPAFALRQVEKKVQLCPACYEAWRELWRMDSEKSFARLEITPIRRKDSLVYKCDTSIQIRPYPNPLSYGGMCGGESAKDKEELAKVIERFKSEVEKLRKMGMTRVEIKENDEVTIAESYSLDTERETQIRSKQEPVAQQTRQLTLF